MSETPNVETMTLINGTRSERNVRQTDNSMTTAATPPPIIPITRTTTKGRPTIQTVDRPVIAPIITISPWAK
jgi:hypothetical protein